MADSHGVDASMDRVGTNGSGGSGVPPAFDNSYARLPERFFVKMAPQPVRAPGLIKANRGLAQALGIDPDWLEGPDGLAMLAGNSVPAGAEPLAMAYAGHQFGQFVPQLGDGRALLIGETVTPDGRRMDIQLKGSGPRAVRPSPMRQKGAVPDPCSWMSTRRPSGVTGSPINHARPSPS